MKKIFLIFYFLIAFATIANAGTYQARAINVAKEGNVVSYTIQVFEVTNTPVKVFQKKYTLNTGNIDTAKAVDRILNHIDLVAQEIYAREEGAETLKKAKSIIEAYTSPKIKKYIPLSDRTKPNDVRP